MLLCISIRLRSARGYRAHRSFLPALKTLIFAVGVSVTLSKSLGSMNASRGASKILFDERLRLGKEIKGALMHYRLKFLKSRSSRGEDIIDNLLDLASTRLISTNSFRGDSNRG